MNVALSLKVPFRVDVKSVNWRSAFNVRRPDTADPSEDVTRLLRTYSGGSGSRSQLNKRKSPIATASSHLVITTSRDDNVTSFSLLVWPHSGIYITDYGRSRDDRGN